MATDAMTEHLTNIVVRGCHCDADASTCIDPYGGHRCSCNTDMSTCKAPGDAHYCVCWVIRYGPAKCAATGGHRCMHMLYGDDGKLCRASAEGCARERIGGK